MTGPAVDLPGVELIPAIDLREGQVVRLTKGDDARRTRYGLDPRDVLRRFAEAGVRRVHVVDLDAAFGETPQRPLIEALGSLARDLDVRLELGGGLRTADDVRWALDAGPDRVIFGSMVARDPDGFLALVDLFPGRLVPALEVAGDAVKVAGWTASAALGLDALCRRLAGLDAPAVLVTDVERDGTMVGPNLELACRVGRALGVPALLSGGVRGLDDLRAAAEHARHAPGELGGVIVGKAFYEGEIDLGEALAVLAGGAS